MTDDRFRVLPNGFMVPAADVACSRVIFKMARDLEAIYPFVKNFGTAIQAGGNFGVFPRLLAAKFAKVVTYEPHPDNFACLQFNTRACPNVEAVQAALGDEHGVTGLALADHEANNFGAFYLTPGEGSTPIVRIDDREHDAVGLIYLDIEGFELKALKGAFYTINTFRPIIVVEDKGLSEKFGSKLGDVEKWLTYTFEYRVLARVHKDVVLGPKF